jgi:hypothetical protein
MKKIVALVLVLAACRAPVSGAPASGSGGAADPTAALKAFMDAAKAQNVQGVGNIWGTQQGPARETFGREGAAEHEKRILTMIMCLKHDQYSVVGEAPAPGGRRTYAVQIRYQDLTVTPNFTAVAGPGGRWFIEAFDLDAVQRICARRS